jgi:hypothetical protein
MPWHQVAVFLFVGFFRSGVQIGFTWTVIGLPLNFFGEWALTGIMGSFIFQSDVRKTCHPGKRMRADAGSIKHHLP